MDPALQELLAEGTPDDEVAVVVRLAAGQPPPEGLRIVTRFSDIATGRLRRGDITALRAEASVLSMKAPQSYLDNDWPTDRADEGADEGKVATPAHTSLAQDLALRASDQRRPEGLSETGRDVLVAHIDWGADINHPDFRHADGSTRFAGLWDQAAAYDPAHPHRFGYGRIYSAADINAALLSDDPYGTLGYTPTRGKQAGGSHGSHTLGISAGNGRAGGPLGLAPDATLFFVDLSIQQQLPGTGLGDSAALLEALDLVAEVASSLGQHGAALPLVVNASLGRQAGQHDGKTLTEQGMDAFLLAAPGRAIVQSTGNYFGRRIHASGLLRPGGGAALDFTVPAAHPPHELDMWYPGPDRFGIQVQGPAGMEAVLAAPGAVCTLLHDGQAVGRVYHRRGDPNNGDHQLALYLDASAPAGTWALQLQADDVVDGRFHAWIERGPGVGAAQAAFTAQDDSPCCTLGTICNGLRTLAVGAVDGHRTQRPLAPFSSGGPTRDGRDKPDLLAPGLRVLSARSAGVDGRAEPLLMRMSGTSMAAPHVTGTVALMFSAAVRPLAIHETRRLLLASTSPAEPAARAVDSWRQGAGHLDVAAAVAAARKVVPLSPLSSTHSSTSDKPAAQPPPPRSPAMQAFAPIEADTLPAAEAPAADESVSRQPCGCSTAEAPDESNADQNLAEADKRGWEGRKRAGALPFQFQIPLGGGAPALALPLGGAGSPLAFTVPLGGTPPAPIPAPVAAPAPAQPGVPALPAQPANPLSADTSWPPNAPPSTLAAVPAAAFDAPVQVAGVVTIGSASANPEADDAPVAAASPVAMSPSRPAPGMAVLSAADAVCHAAQRGKGHAPGTSSQWLSCLLAGFSLRGDGGAAPTATTLFNAFVFADGHPMRQRQQARFGQHLTVVARQGDDITNLRLQAGDLLLRVAPGEGHGHVAVVASPLVARRDELPSLGWQPAGHQQARDGQYLQVVEVLPHVRSLADRWARRLADTRGRVLPHTLLLRRAAPASIQLTHAEDPLEALAEDAGADVRWLQNALNQVLGTQLTVDGDAGPATRRAVRSFQSRSGLAADGIAGPRTLGALREALQRGGGTAGPSGSNVPNTAPTTTAAAVVGLGGAAAGATGPCDTLAGFPQGRDTLSGAHQAQIIAAARRILRDGITTVLVTGFASSEGGDVDNFVLGMQRASRVSGELRSALERLRPGSGNSVAIVPTSRGESDQVDAGDRPSNRRVTICLQARRPEPRPDPAPTPASTRVFRVVAKSFIARVGSLVGTLDCELGLAGDIAAGLLLGPVGGLIVDRLAPIASNAALVAMARVTDASFSENPADDSVFTAPPPQNKGYRLLSHGQVTVSSRGTDLLAVTLPGGIDLDAGKECVPGTGVCLQAPPLIIDQPFVTRRIDASRIAFRWGVKGRPPSALEPGIQAVCQRDSVFIWHQVDGVVDCSSGSPRISSLALVGSRFPSHRLWLDGALARDRPQGPMSALWDGTPGDPTRIR